MHVQCIFGLLIASAIASPLAIPSQNNNVAGRDASPASAASIKDCPTDSFAIFTGPSKNDGQSGYPWLDLQYYVRAITDLDIDTPERSAFRIENHRLKPAVVNTTLVATVRDDVDFLFLKPTQAKKDSPIVTTVSKVNGTCYVQLQAGDDKFLSMQNYKGCMHLTPSYGYSSRWWGEGPFEMVPWAAPWKVHTAASAARR